LQLRLQPVCDHRTKHTRHKPNAETTADAPHMRTVHLTSRVGGARQGVIRTV
jgi:hypothetical protein